MNEYLFMGGSRDGERIGVPPGAQKVDLPDRRSERLKPNKVLYPEPTEIYRRVSVTGETASDRFEFFAHKDLNGNDIMRALIECYQRVPQAKLAAAAPEPAVDRRMPLPKRVKA